MVLKLKLKLKLWIVIFTETSSNATVWIIWSQNGQSFSKRMPDVRLATSPENPKVTLTDYLITMIPDLLSLKGKEFFLTITYKDTNMRKTKHYLRVEVEHRNPHCRSLLYDWANKWFVECRHNLDWYAFEVLSAQESSLQAVMPILLPSPSAASKTSDKSQN